MKEIKKITGMVVGTAMCGESLKVKMPNGQYLVTSPILKVHHALKGVPHFETKNSIYVVVAPEKE